MFQLKRNNRASNTKRNENQISSFYNEKDEIDIVKRAKRGEASAFGQLYDTHMPRIFRFIMLKVGRKETAEDLAHEVFLSAWQNIANYEFRGFPFSSWLYRIANNAVIDYYRTWKSTQALETIPEEFFSETPELDNEIDKSIDLKVVRHALAKLENDQQNVLIMKFVDDLSNKEIADIIGKSEGAVRVIQHRALKQLKKHIDAGIYPPTKTA
jgi:RNA polymerase sigma-70 factor (ECF subfamily)